MATEIKLPELAENFKKGQVVEVKVAPGDVVMKDQTLLVVDAEKATLDAVAPMAGKVTKLLVKPGDEIKLNQTYCLIEAAGANGESSPPSKPAATPKTEPLTESTAAAREMEQTDEAAPPSARPKPTSLSPPAPPP